MKDRKWWLLLLEGALTALVGSILAGLVGSFFKNEPPDEEFVFAIIVLVLWLLGIIIGIVLAK